NLAAAYTVFRTGILQAAIEVAGRVKDHVLSAGTHTAVVRESIENRFSPLAACAFFQFVYRSASPGLAVDSLTAVLGSSIEIAGLIGSECRFWAAAVFASGKIVQDIFRPYPARSGNKLENQTVVAVASLQSGAEHIARRIDRKAAEWAAAVGSIGEDVNHVLRPHAGTGLCQLKCRTIVAGTEVVSGAVKVARRVFRKPSADVGPKHGREAEQHGFLPGAMGCRRQLEKSAGAVGAA